MGGGGSSAVAGSTRSAALALALAALSGCGGAGPHTQAPSPRDALRSTPPSAFARIEVRRLDAKPKLTLVSRDGDPQPALVVAVATDLGPASTTALAALVEARLRARRLDLDTRVDRSGFRVRFLVADAAQAPALFAAIADALHRPIQAGAPELALVRQRLDALRRNPLDAPELVPIAACTGRLGVTAAEPLPDVASDAGVRDLDAKRAAALGAGRTSIAIVGPAPFCAAAASAFERSAGWDPGPPPTDAPAAEDSVGVYAAPSLTPGSASITVALRVSDPEAAVAAAARLGAPDSPLVARLSALPEPFRATAVAGVARPRGGCVSVTVDASRVQAVPVQRSAAVAAALVRDEIDVELAGPKEHVAEREILGAADPREAASRAAWWALAAAAPDGAVHGATVLAVAPSEGADAQKRLDAIRHDFPVELARARASRRPLVEQRGAVERGQGELWVVLASPCGVYDESERDAGASALASIAASAYRRRALGVAVEPWITADGIGVLAHSAPREGETAAELARRVGDAAARTLAGTAITPEALSTARALLLERLETGSGREAAALEAFARAIAPDHPSWVDPFGVWSRVAGGDLEVVRLRWQALATGPLRAAVLANADAAQVATAASAIERWLAPQGEPRSCPPPTPVASKAGRYDVRLGRGARAAQAAIGAPVPPPGSPGYALAQVTAALLDGPDGALARALAAAPVAARATARLVGGGRASALLIDVRATEDAVDPALDAVRQELARLAQSGPSDAELASAIARVDARDREARLEPRSRVIALWTGRPAPAPAPPTPASLRDFVAKTLGDSALVVVAAKPE